MKPTPHAPQQVRAISIRTQMARKILLMFGLGLGVYLALLPLLHRIAD